MIKEIEELKDNSVKAFYKEMWGENTFADRLKVKKTADSEDGKAKSLSFDLAGSSAEGKKKGLEQVFKLADTAAFEKKFDEICAGSEEALVDITTLHSTKLLSLLMLYGVSRKNPLTLMLDGKEVTFTESKFNYQNQGIPGKEPSTIDIVLTGTSKNKITVLFLETRFSEYCLNLKKTMDVSREYLEDKYVSGKIYNSEKLNEKLQLSVKPAKAKANISLKSNESMYLEGITRLIAQYNGVSNFAKGKSSIQIYLSELIFTDGIGELPIGKTKNKCFDSYSKKYEALAEIINANNEIGENFKMLSTPLSFDKIASAKGYRLDDLVRLFYFGKKLSSVKKTENAEKIKNTANTEKTDKTVKNEISKITEKADIRPVNTRFTVDSEYYVHDSDRKALEALKAIPGFTQVTKAFMSVWNERQFKILNMSSHLKVSDRQLKKYYDMLPPICEKLGIEVPELYIEMDVNPNAYTYGDTKPFIVLTSGLFDCMPEELIPTVLAHECGHIACRHTLYTTMGRLILSGAGFFSNGLIGVAMQPIQLAFAYWMRCSEYSADRAAAICDGSAEKTIEMCMRFSGYNKNIQEIANSEEFINQAIEYKELVKNSALNKTLEFMMFKNNDHPLNAVRAYEAREWSKDDRFVRVANYLLDPSEENMMELPAYLRANKLIGMNVEEAVKELYSMGALNVERSRISNGRGVNGTVSGILVDGIDVSKARWISRSSKVEVVYYQAKSIEELALEHPGQICMPNSARYYLGQTFFDTKDELFRLGFYNIEEREMAMPRFNFTNKVGFTSKVTIGNVSQFEKGDWFDSNAKVVIYFWAEM